MTGLEEWEAKNRQDEWDSHVLRSAADVVRRRSTRPKSLATKFTVRLLESIAEGIERKMWGWP